MCKLLFNYSSLCGAFCSIVQGGVNVKACPWIKMLEWSFSFWLGNKHSSEIYASFCTYTGWWTVTFSRTETSDSNLCITIVMPTKNYIYPLTFNSEPCTTMALACLGSTSSSGIFKRLAISSFVSVPKTTKNVHHQLKCLWTNGMCVGLKPVWLSYSMTQDITFHS